MKNHISFLLRLAIATLIVFPALALAVPTTAPYNTDVTNSYVQDQTSQVMGRLNSILCYMGAMAPNLMVNEGNYIALVDENTCGSGGGSGGKSNNTGPAYSSVVVNSARASNTDPMLVKVWLAPQSGVDMKVYATAT
ncbi:MAG: hypothetical protein Q7S51_02680 [Gallionellaceae bacterium]|nr:hypothetical protein [Gallionellaceae bacterium]